MIFIVAIRRFRMAESRIPNQPPKYRSGIWRCPAAWISSPFRLEAAARRVPASGDWDGSWRHILDERFGSSHLSTGMVRAGQDCPVRGPCRDRRSAIRSTEEPTTIPSETDRPLPEGTTDGGAVFRVPSPERIGHSQRPMPGPGWWRVHRRTRLRRVPRRLERLAGTDPVKGRPHLRSPACATRPHTSDWSCTSLISLPWVPRIGHSWRR